MKFTDGILPFLVAGAVATSCCAQIAVAPDPYRDEPYVFEHFDTSVKMHADGTGDRVVHVAVRVQSEGTAREFSVLSLPYASANDTAAIEYVRVHKPNGTVVETSTADTIEMPGAVTREAPVYSDIKEKHLPVRSLSSGDTLEYQFHLVVTKAEAPNQFWGAAHFITGGGVVLSETLLLEAPASIYLQVWSPNHPATPTVHDGLKTWTWNSSQIKPSSRNADGKMTAAEVKDPDEDSDGRKLPSVAWTTFHSWAEVGDWYRSLIEPRMVPTAAIRAKADELTKGAPTQQAKAEALYRFVATQIRYVSISFGTGRIQPHAAEEVLANGYGDCKDKDTLLESLLRAEGFATAPVLIGAGIAPVPDVPSPAVFNHEITTMTLPSSGTPQDRIWLDTTAEVAPFRVLIPVLRDQEALVVPAGASARLMKTPSEPPFPYLLEASFAGTLDNTGLLKGRQSITLRSDAELVWRAIAMRAAPNQWDQVMAYMAVGMGYTGKATNTDLRQTGPVDAPFRISFDYTAEDFYNWKSGQVIGLFPSLDLPSVDKDKQPEHDIDMGAPRTLRGHSVIKLPDGYRAELPTTVRVQTDFARYEEHWKLEDGTLFVDREVSVLEPKLSRTRWKEYLDFCKKTTDQGELTVSVIPPNSPSNSTVAGGQGETLAGSTQEEIVKALGEAQRRGDWETARSELSQLQTKYPDARRTHSWAGYIAAHDKRYDLAEQQFKAELAAYPDDVYPVTQMVQVYAQQKRYSDAVALLKQYSRRRDPALLSQLVTMESLSGNYAEALDATDEALSIKPEDKGFQTEKARLLLKMHRDDDAAAAAERALEGNNDPNLINSNAYFLAETKLELPLAETSSRRSVEMFDRMNSAGAVEEANTRAFALSAQMVAAWDTLGDILLIEDKAKAAEAYLAASWFDAPDAAKGNHLSDAYERLGRKPEARLIAKLTLSLPGTPIDKDDRAAVEARDARLEKEGVKLATGKPATLQELRTFHVKNAPGVQGSGTVRVQLSGAGIVDATLVAGDASLKPLLGDLKTINTPIAVPPASPAKVLRDAVLYCGKGSKECDFVFMERSGIAEESSPK